MVIGHFGLGQLLTWKCLQLGELGANLSNSFAPKHNNNLFSVTCSVLSGFLNEWMPTQVKCFTHTGLVNTHKIINFTSSWCSGFGSRVSPLYRLKSLLSCLLKPSSNDNVSQINTWESSTWLAGFNLTKAIAWLVSIMQPHILWNWPGKSMRSRLFLTVALCKYVKQMKSFQTVTVENHGNE